MFSDRSTITCYLLSGCISHEKGWMRHACRHRMMRPMNWRLVMRILSSVVLAIAKKPNHGKTTSPSLEAYRIQIAVRNGATIFLAPALGPAVL